MADATGHASPQSGLLSGRIAELELQLSALGARLRELQLRHAVASCLSDDLELLPTLRLFRAQAAGFFPGAAFALVFLQSDGKMSLALADEPLASLSESAFSSASGPFVQAMSQRHPLRVPPGVAQELWPAGHEQLPELLLAPLVREETPAEGILIVARPQSIGFSPQEEELVAAAARELASVLHKVKVFVRTKELSITDPLTGLYNRRHLEERLEQEVARASRYRHPLTVLLIDIDHFKLYNDLNGHLEGDKALRAIAALLRRHTRQADLVARFGGEEFVVLLPEIDLTDGRAAAEKLRRTVQRSPFAGEASLPGGELTISVGVATFPRDAEEPVALLDLADRGLYLSKRRGRNCVSHFLDET